MDQASGTPPVARAVRIMHGALVAGVLLVGGVFFSLLRIRGQAPATGRTLGVALAAVSIGLVLVAASVLRRRVPERRPEQSPDAYWAAVESRGPAIVLWAVTEGASLISLVGYFLSGATAPAAAAAVAIAMLILYRPSHLEGAA